MESLPYIAGPEVADLTVWKEHMERLLGKDKKLSGIFVAPPCETTAEIEASNYFVLNEVKKNPDCKSMVLISPRMGRDRVEKYLEDPNVVGMKPFSYYADYNGPCSDAPLETFLPEWAWQCAHKHGLMFLVHLARRDSLADPLNYEYIRNMAKNTLMLSCCWRLVHVGSIWKLLLQVSIM